MVSASGARCRESPSASFAPPTPPAMASTCTATLARRGGRGGLPLQLDLGPRRAFERGRVLAAVLELLELDEVAVRSETLGCLIVRQIEGFGFVRLHVEAAADPVQGGALGRHAADVADPAAQLARRDQLPERRAGRGRDALVDERAADVVA